jgi:hypothetical protein
VVVIAGLFLWLPVEAVYIGGGATGSFSQANSQISVGASGGRLTVSVTGAQTWSRADFVLPSSLSQFEAGYFGNLTRYPFHNPAVGGMDWSKDHRGCNVLSGSFTVDRVTYSGAALTAIDLHFVQHCENQSPALYGWLHWER